MEQERNCTATADWRYALGTAPGLGWDDPKAALSAFETEKAIHPGLTLARWLSDNDPAWGSGGVGSYYPDYDACAAALLAEAGVVVGVRSCPWCAGEGTEGVIPCAYCQGDGELLG